MEEEYPQNNNPGNINNTINTVNNTLSTENTVNNKYNKFAILALVLVSVCVLLAIVSFVMTLDVMFFLTFIFAMIGLFFSIIAISQIKRTNQKGKVIAIVSLVLGILLLLAIVWIILKSIFAPGEMNIEVSPECLDTEIRAISVTNTTPSNFTVTLTRISGEEAIAGVKLVLSDYDEVEQYVTDVPGNIDTSMDKNVSFALLPDTVSNPKKIWVVVYFLDDSGDEKLCTVSTEFDF